VFGKKVSCEHVKRSTSDRPQQIPTLVKVVLRINLFSTDKTG
jgi:hypothetical protein